MSYNEKQRAAQQRYYRKNREKVQARGREWARRNAKQMKDRELIREFGIGLEERNRRIAVRQGRCDICEQVPKGTLHIDHNHHTKENRGMLCVNCNIGIGMFKDNVDFLARAMVYLKQYGGA